MQPFQQMARASSGSTMGWDPASVRSMILSRRCPRATRPADHTPAPSGPRSTMASAIAATAVISGVRPSSRTSPVAPHTRLLVPPGRAAQTTARPGSQTAPLGLRLEGRGAHPAGGRAYSRWLPDALELVATGVDLADRPLEPLLHRRVPVDVEQDQHYSDQDRRVVDELPFEPVDPRHAADRRREQRDDRGDDDLDHRDGRHPLVMTAQIPLADGETVAGLPAVVDRHRA